LPVTDAVKDMVVLPYKDSLLLFSRYLQQLVMESLGKDLTVMSTKALLSMATKARQINTPTFSSCARVCKILHDLY